MTRFHDGPARSKVLMLRRAPLLLRVTVDPEGKVDALDQVADTPAAGEVLYAYERQGKPGAVHIDFTRPRGSAWYAIADYRLCDPQPADATMRDTEGWRAWCLAEQAARKALSPAPPTPEEPCPPQTTTAIR